MLKLDSLLRLFDCFRYGFKRSCVADFGEEFLEFVRILEVLSGRVEDMGADFGVCVVLF